MKRLHFKVFCGKRCPVSGRMALAVTALAAVTALTGCGGKDAPQDAWNKERDNRENMLQEMGEDPPDGSGRAESGGGKTEKPGDTSAGALGEGKPGGIDAESAGDAEVDFDAIRKENPDIFAWIYIPGTEIDDPVLQSTESDDYYKSRNEKGEPDEKGALYTELANMKNMCDFNTVIHGTSSGDGETGLFADLYRFADPDFFENHKEVYLYLEGNLLTYTVFAAYEREESSLIRSYDFTYGEGCEQFLKEVYGSREMGKNLREGWEGLNAGNFLLTLTAHREGEARKQFVVIAALVGDAAGEIDRIVEWQDRP